MPKVITTAVMEFISGYIDCALFTSYDDKENALSKNYSFEDIDPECYDKMCEDCYSFIGKNKKFIKNNMGRAGHDFWLTRNHHGAGFWDGDWKMGEYLTEKSHEFGSVDLYVGDDGRIYS